MRLVCSGNQCWIEHCGIPICTSPEGQWMHIGNVVENGVLTIIINDEVLYVGPAE